MTSRQTTKLSKPIVKNAEPPVVGTADHKRGYSIIWDSEISGVGLLTTNGGVKSFIVRARIKGKERRHTLGRANVLGVDVARDLAKAWLGKIAAGGDPVEDERIDKASSITLRDAMLTYCKSGVRESTQKLVQDRFMCRLSAWLDIPLVRISGDMVERRYLGIAEKHPPDANITFRYFRAVWNSARRTSEYATGQALLPECPTQRLTSARLWKPDTRRKRSVEPHQLASFLSTVDTLSDPKSRLIFRFVMYTGCRISEAANLQWRGVDFQSGTVTFYRTKSRVNDDLTIPMTRQLDELLKQARDAGVGEYVFGDLQGKRRKHPFAHETDILRNASRATGGFGPHDLRRTFTSTANAVGVPGITLKALVNHSQKSDVTAGYDSDWLEPKRQHAQRIADQLDAYATTGVVVPFRRVG